MPSRRHAALCVLLVAVCCGYANSLGNSFHFDDFHAVTDNPSVRSLRNVPRFFLDATAFSVLPANQTYRPLVTASLAVDYALGHGYRPLWFHLSTLFWFLLLIALLFRVAAEIFDRAEPGVEHGWLALGVAAWFGLHPAMAETVNYVIQRGDLYCTLGCVAGLLLFALHPAKRRFGLYLLPFVLAMLAKPPAAVFPLLLALYVWLFEGALGTGARWLQALRAAWPATLLTAGLLWFEYWMTPRSYAPGVIPAVDYRLTQPFVWLRYCLELVLPLHLNVDTDLQAFHWLGARVWLGLVFAGLLVTTASFCGRRQRLYPIAFGLWWFVLTQLPTSLYALSEVENDHRMFFSFPGLMLAGVWALHLGFQRVLAQWELPNRRRVAVTAVASGLCVCALGAYGCGAHHRNAVWRNEVSLWADDVAKSPHNGRGLMIYGLTRMSAGDLDGALQLFERARVFAPNYPTLEVNLGVVNGLLARRGDVARGVAAEAHFRRAVKLAPGDDVPHSFYGRWLLAQGRLDEATEQLRVAVALNGQRLLQRDLLLEALMRQRRPEAARTLAASTLRIVPDDGIAQAAMRGVGAEGQAGALIDASLAAYRGGDYRRSIEEAKAALRLAPDSAEAWNNVAAGEAAMRRWNEAVTAAQRAVALRPDFQLARNNLAWSLAQRDLRRQ